MRETEHLFNALRFLTVIPVPDAEGEMAPDWLARAIRYFPVVGIGIGLACALVLLIANALWVSDDRGVTRGHDKHRGDVRAARRRPRRYF